MPDSTLGGMAALLSRPALRQAFNRLLADPAHVDGHVVVVVLNVDRFKRVNDLLGFDAGDRILGQIVERLDLALNALTPRPLGLSLARLHGDELAVLLPADTAARGMPEWLADVLRAFKGLVLPDVINHHRLLGTATPALQASAHKLARTMVRAKLLAHEDPFDQLIQADFLPPDALEN